ncbi:WD40/YVTN/BNR-like repeat-containing protein [Belliella aquatica]|uniref:Oxidoreductase n=1 Tax=Belliella aquatica TaxID=1323734 RepID=A0ABQ1MNH6_9BACT|nr:YCF48-related protein [Belliella aquatica]MCH7405952.1 YCF48-related protein [Belliella aquatica]GGC43879.1 oxidoreductase [Belliella aquatica]
MKFKFLLAIGIISSFAACNSERKGEIITEPTGWEIVETPVNASIRGLSPLTSEIIWASGSGGTWLLTIDGGQSWSTGIIAGLDSVDFRDIEGLDANTAIAIAAGQPAVIYKTTDSGATWQKKFEGPETAFLDGIAFHKDQKGYVIGDPIDGKWMVLETIDAGETWTWIESSPMAEPGEGSFAASGSTILADQDHIWFASGGIKSKVYMSTDGGHDWEISETPIIQGEPSQGIFSITKLDNSNLIAVGGDYLQPDLALNNTIYSKEMGKNWELVSSSYPSGYRSGVTYFPRFHWAISVGTNGSDYSVDGGINWQKFSDEGFHAVFMDKAQGSIWASGLDGKIARLVY